MFSFISTGIVNLALLKSVSDQSSIWVTSELASVNIFPLRGKFLFLGPQVYHVILICITHFVTVLLQRHLTPGTWAEFIHKICNVPFCGSFWDSRLTLQQSWLPQAPSPGSSSQKDWGSGCLNYDCLSKTTCFLLTLWSPWLVFHLFDCLLPKVSDRCLPEGWFVRGWLLHARSVDERGFRMGRGGRRAEPAKAPDRPHLIKKENIEFGCMDGGGADFRGWWASRLGRGSRRRTRASSLLLSKFYNGECSLNAMERVWAPTY